MEVFKYFFMDFQLKVISLQKQNKEGLMKFNG